MTDRLTALVWPMGKPPSPTDADKAKAAEWVDAWFAREDFCPVWRARNRDDMITSQARTEMYDRIRRQDYLCRRLARGFEQIVRGVSLSASPPSTALVGLRPEPLRVSAIRRPSHDARKRA